MLAAAACLFGIDFLENDMKIKVSLTEGRRRKGSGYVWVSVGEGSLMLDYLPARQLSGE